MATCGFCHQPITGRSITMRRKGTKDEVEFCDDCYRRWLQQKEVDEFEASTFVGRNLLTPRPGSSEDRAARS